MNAVDVPFGLASKFAGFKTPFATAMYEPPLAKVTWKFFNVSFTEVLFPPATPMFNKTPAGTSMNGVAVRNAKLSNLKVPLM